MIIGAIASAGIPANRLGLEITESVFFHNGAVVSLGASEPRERSMLIDAMIIIPENSNNRVALEK